MLGSSSFTFHIRFELVLFRGVPQLMKSLLVCLWLVAAMLSTEAHAAERSPGSMSESGAAEARIVAVKKIDARMLDLMVGSPAMGMSIPVRVILPKSWKEKPKATFPVLYMFHGGD